jgi:hypothetical protein
VAEPSTVSDFLYVLRNEAGQAAERLAEKVVDMKKELYEAEKVLGRLDRLAQTAEAAAELVAASDLEPDSRADVPEQSGLVRRETSDGSV